MALVYDHGLYFDAEGAEVVELDKLVPTKPPEAQPESVSVAEERMGQAAEGRIERRGPITVRAIGDGRYEIIDGNATYGVAVRAGWPDLPVMTAS